MTCNNYFHKEHVCFSSDFIFLHAQAYVDLGSTRANVSGMISIAIVLRRSGRFLPLLIYMVLQLFAYLV